MIKSRVVRMEGVTWMKNRQQICFGVCQFESLWNGAPVSVWMQGTRKQGSRLQYAHKATSGGFCLASNSRHQRGSGFHKGWLVTVSYN